MGSFRKSQEDILAPDRFEELIHHDGRGAIFLSDLARGTGVFDGIFCHGFQGGARAFLIVKGEQSFAVRVEIGPAGLLQNNGTTESEISRAAATLRSLNQPQRDRT